MSELTAVEKLKKACDDAYTSHPTSCSHAVWYVITQIVDAQQTYRQANQLVDFCTGNWKEVTVEEGHKLANQGIVVAGGLKNASGSGHVIAIYPGEMILNGGYEYYYAKEGKNLILKGTKTLPRCLSTSSGAWPGAKSKGDKTVWDPWAKDTVFAGVKFGTPKTKVST